MKNKNKLISLITISILTLAVVSAVVMHNANEIWVFVDGQEMTLQEAVSTVGLCSVGPSSYSQPKPNPGHYASEMELSSSKTLQQAIDDSDFCGTTSTYCDSRECGPDTCGGYCGPYYDSCPSGQVCQSGNCVSDQYCGDGSCNGAETESSCPADCAFVDCYTGSDPHIWDGQMSDESDELGCYNQAIARGARTASYHHSAHWCHLWSGPMVPADCTWNKAWQRW